MNKADRTLRLKSLTFVFFVALLAVSQPQSSVFAQSENAENTFIERSVAYTSKQQRFNDYLFEGKETKTAIA